MTGLTVYAKMLCFQPKCFVQEHMTALVVFETATSWSRSQYSTELQCSLTMLREGNKLSCTCRVDTQYRFQNSLTFH